MKKTILASLLILLLINGLYAQKASKSNNQIPTLAWVGVPEAETTTERFMELKEAGFTHNFSFYTSEDAFEKALRIAEKTGIKMILNCPELKTEPEKTVKRFMKSKALAAYYLTDEPGRSSFPELGEWARRIQAVDDTHFCYLNLFPNYAPASALGTDTYREHVNIFIKEVPLQVLSFDHYPVVGASSTDVREIWYENLEIIADEAAKANKPFWAFALTVSHGPYPIPTIPALRLQIYTDLAYGAQGIQYFTYQTPLNTAWDFHDAPLTKDMKRNQVYDMVKSMNQEIKTLSPVFLGAKMISVGYTGQKIPNATRRISVLPAPIKSVETEGLGAVVSHLKKGNDEYLVIVNRDIVNPMKLTVKTAPEVQKVLKDGKVVLASTYEDTLIVAPGDVQIYKWK